jgi:hypothetical protein
MKVKITESQLKIVIKEVRNKEEDRVKIYQDENIVVVAPLTHRSSCKYGAYTKWCTAVPSTDEHFNEYMRNGVLIYFIIRSPHKKTTKTEYKFAYYHPFSEEGEEFKGWYDMSDNQLEFNGDEKKVDMNLIKFLIPDEIFVMVKDYIKTQKPIWTKKQKETRREIAQYFINDTENTKNTIVNDDNWFISYRTTPLDSNKFYSDNNLGYVYFSKGSVNIFYVDKKTSVIYKQQLDYYKDLRNYEFNKIFLPPIEEVYNDKPSEKMISVFDKYYPQILKTYFKVRKENFDPSVNSYFYLPIQYLQKDDTVGTSGLYQKVLNIYIDPRNNRPTFDTIDSKGEVRKNYYYNDILGVGIQYDKNRHNPI